MSQQELLTISILDKIRASTQSLKEQWEYPLGTKTRHFCIDELLSPQLCKEIYQSFPKDGNGFYNRETFREKKRTSADLSSYDAILSDITYAFQDFRIINLISDIVGYRNIEPDPRLYAGGLSMMFLGDFLNPHLDNSHDADRKRYRRLNLLYYVSPNWQTENGGNLELWDEQRNIPKTITAKENRLVVMETNKFSWHSVSPIMVNNPRCCVSNYYFSSESPDSSKYFHVTSFTGRPQEKYKKIIGVVDNYLRNFISNTLKIGRGKKLTNKQKGD